jgi:hypothetical protein
MEHTEAHESAGTDSFLDVTTNIVGILIILVMIVGMRAQNPIVQAASMTESEDKVAALTHQAANIEYDARRLSEQTQAVENEIKIKSAERQVIATMISAAEHEIEDQRSKLDSEKQADFDLRRQLEESRAMIGKGEADLKSLENIKAPVQEVRHYPTPLSRTVIGHEIQFQLSAGRIVNIPWDDFFDDVRGDLRRTGRDLLNNENEVGVVGPRNGFELHYVLATVAERGRIVGVVTKEAILVPLSNDQGETVSDALKEKSDFRAILARNSPHETTVTLWTYADSFEDFRRLKAELQNLGYAVSGRPMPKGMPIGFSREGTKSLAQ